MKRIHWINNWIGERYGVKDGDDQEGKKRKGVLEFLYGIG